jgi:uncharacterized protein (TIGR00106 family)
MAIVAVSISPLGEGVGVSQYIAEAQKVLESQDRVRFRLDPMFTTLDGDLDEIMALIRDMQEAVFAAGAVRVSSVIKVDDRRDKEARMEEKVASVVRKLKN